MLVKRPEHPEAKPFQTKSKLFKMRKLDYYDKIFERQVCVEKISWQVIHQNVWQFWIIYLSSNCPTAIIDQGN